LTDHPMPVGTDRRGPARRVSGAGQLDPIQQRPERGDLIALAVHLDLTEHHLAGVVHDREQVHLIAGESATAQCLAVHRHGVVRCLGSRRFVPAEEAALARDFGAASDRYRAAVKVRWL
jgi:hypothetical protein